MERSRDFENYVLGEERKTFGRTITETDFVVHAGHTGDFFPHHMDAEHMKSSEWGQTPSGPITAGSSKPCG